MARSKHNTKSTPPRKKRRGLRSFLTLLILSAAGAAVFRFGWVGFDLEAGEYGVIFTKFSGWENKAVAAGDFEWRFQALFPTNLTLEVYSPIPRRSVVEARGSLPSGSFYGELISSDMRFEWSIEAEIAYRINPAKLPVLASSGVKASNLDNRYAEYESRLQGAAGRMLEAGFPGRDIGKLEHDLQEAAAALDEYIEVIDVTVLDWRYPDLELYEEVRGAARELLQARKALLAEMDEAAIRRDDVQSARINLLERYGKVLSAHPVLLDLFALEGNPGSGFLPPPEDRRP